MVKNDCRSQHNSTVGKVLASYDTDRGLIPNIPYDPLSMPREIPEFRTDPEVSLKHSWVWSKHQKGKKKSDCKCKVIPYQGFVT